MCSCLCVRERENVQVISMNQSVCRLSDCLDGEAETVMQLRSELREKEMKLTDIRLEALSSAHQLDQLREAMNHMQVTHPHTVKRTRMHTHRQACSLMQACSNTGK